MAPMLQVCQKGALQQRNSNTATYMTEETPRVTFFHLPRELRDLIYDYALGANQLCFRYGRLGFLVSPTVLEPTLSPLNGLPLWLLTSRSICDEAVTLILLARRFNPNTTVHQCEPPLPLKPRCIAPWHPPRLTRSQRARMNLEQRQHQVREFERQLGNTIPKPRRATTVRKTIPAMAAAKPSPVLSCSTMSQPLLLHLGSVRHITLNLPVNLTFLRSPAFAYDITIINDTRPWYEFLVTIYPFLHPLDLQLTLTWDAEEPEHLEPYFDWPVEWLGRFLRVDVALLATEADSAELKQRIEVVVHRLTMNRHQDSTPAIWGMELVFQEPTLPPCEVHGEACPHVHLQRPRLSEISRYMLSLSP
jgi:hypothetical protein